MNPPFSIFIIDDNQGCIDTLRASLDTYPNFVVTGAFQSPFDALGALLEKRPEILFLDVEMPSVSGLDFLSNIKEKLHWNLHVVFYTAYEKYVIQALRNAAFDFLLKPFTEEELKGILDRFLLQSLQSYTLNKQVDRLKEHIETNKTYLLTDLLGYRICKSDQILFYEYDKPCRCWFVHLNDGTHIKLKRDITSEALLKQAEVFVRISQKHIINVNYLVRLDNSFCYLTTSSEYEKSFEVSREGLKQLKARFDEL
jgi:two-component system LytT family response regulator